MFFVKYFRLGLLELFANLMGSRGSRAIDSDLIVQRGLDPQTQM